MLSSPVYREIPAVMLNTVRARHDHSNWLQTRELSDYFDQQENYISMMLFLNK
jgi:hypothetical protein